MVTIFGYVSSPREVRGEQSITACCCQPPPPLPSSTSPAASPSSRAAAARPLVAGAAPSEGAWAGGPDTRASCYKHRLLVCTLCSLLLLYSLHCCTAALSMMALLGAVHRCTAAHSGRLCSGPECTACWGLATEAVSPSCIAAITREARGRLYSYTGCRTVRHYYRV